jgi:hypothetical protein
MKTPFHWTIFSHWWRIPPRDYEKFHISVKCGGVKSSLMWFGIIPSVGTTWGTTSIFAPLQMVKVLNFYSFGSDTWKCSAIWWWIKKKNRIHVSIKDYFNLHSLGYNTILSNNEVWSILILILILRIFKYILIEKILSLKKIEDGK